MKPKASPARQSDQSGPPALFNDELAARLAAIAAANTAARADLEAHFGAERFAKLLKTPGITDEQLTALCGKMRRTRNEWHPGNPAAALHAAGIGLLEALGRQARPEDLAAYDAAKAETAS